MPPRSNLWLLLTALTTAGALAACGGDDDNESGSDAGTSSGQAGASSGTSGFSSGNSGTSSGQAGTSSGQAGTSSGQAGTSSGQAGTSSGEAGSSSGEAGSSSGEPIPADGPDEPPVAFPMTEPELFGYKLTNQFPHQLWGAMAISWQPGFTAPFVLQRSGSIVQLRPDGSVAYRLQFENQVLMAGEAGALGMAFHPQFTAQGAARRPYVYIWYTTRRDANGRTRQRLSRFTWTGAPGAQNGNFNAEQVLIEQEESSIQHNGAHLRFGPDGNLYFGNGDDLAHTTTTQRLNAGLFSGLFRIDVDCRPGSLPSQGANSAMRLHVASNYCIPADNPFRDVPGARHEYYALGLRNPNNFTFDRQTGELWLADVGDSWREEINKVAAGDNFGWPFYEGTKRFSPGEPTIGNHKPPTYEYPHWQIADLCAVSGGYVYRGNAMPELRGHYLFSDWPTGRVWALDPATGVRRSLLEWNPHGAPVGWGEDLDGEIYMVTWYKIAKLERTAPHNVPLKLSQTKIFRNTHTRLLPSSVHPYEIRSPLWSDGASKSRYVYVPENQRGVVQADGKIDLPPGSLLIKNFDLPDSANPQGRGRRLETRVLVFGNQGSYGLTYRWNAAGTDADLVTDAVYEDIVDQNNPAENVTWHYPSFGECHGCHRGNTTQAVPDRVIGFRGEQMNFDINGQNQLQQLAAAGVLDATSVANAPAPLVDPADETASPDARASAYFAANCAGCHQPGNTFLGDQSWNALPNIAPGARGLLNAPNHNAPMARELGLPGGRLVVPGQPNNSLLLRRMQSTDRDLLMPALGRTKVDPVGVSVIQAWISSL